MKKIVLYIKNHCPYCQQAIALLTNKELEFETISVDEKEEEYSRLKERTGHQTVPQIFVGDHFIGGYRELSAFEATGELDRLLNS